MVNRAIHAAARGGYLGDVETPRGRGRRTFWHFRISRCQGVHRVAYCCCQITGSELEKAGIAQRHLKMLSEENYFITK
ncbi:hypothetical protein Fmac_016348 [Flemingia macrophylla]|uniref:Ribosomal protein S14 n=1 Tax=Flemingia macrophylla TaxID=520843 RepID=A0ABD1MJB1_9FABA